MLFTRTRPAILTNNQRSRVRVTPPAPARRKRHIACDEPFYFINGSSRAHSAAPRFQHTNALLVCLLILTEFESVRIGPRRRGLRIVRDGAFLRYLSLAPSLLLSEANPLRWASVRGTSAFSRESGDRQLFNSQQQSGAGNACAAFSRFKS